MDHLSDFIGALAAAGFTVARASDIKADDKWNRVSVNGERAKNLRYQLKIDGNFGVGRFIHSVEGVSHKWHSKISRKLTREERDAITKRIEEDRARSAQERDELELAAAKKAQGIWKAAARGAHGYLERKGINGEWAKVFKGALVVPLWNNGALWAVQYISAAGNKRFSKNGRINGSYAALAQPRDDKSTIVICEGYATGESIRMATGWPVIVAFVAGNLDAVARAMREKYPEARIIIAADNDQWTFLHGRRPEDIEDPKTIPGDDPRWTEWRARGLLMNTGIDKAEQAAVKIGAHVVFPDIPGDDPGKRTDFNDIHMSDGLEAVRARLEIGASSGPSQESSVPGFQGEDSPHHDSQPGGGDFSQEERDYSFYEKLPTGDFNMKFKVLGYNNGLYYYFPFAARQIIALSAAAHTMQNLLQLGDLNEWEHEFGGEKISHSRIALLASNAMIQMAKRRGVFQEEDRVRGCGAWIDEGRMVLHCGDRLFVDGKAMNFDDLESYYTYVAAARLITPSENPLTNIEAFKLRQICESVTWENKLSGSLLAGWLVIAPICAALAYRPHIYLTGEAESGKSTVENKIIKPVIGRIGFHADGGTTEASIRERMGYDGRPLIFDEAEGEQNKMAMLGVIELARKASTGATVMKFGQRPFRASFCACFSAINPPVNKIADESRMSFMVIKKNRKPTAIQDYEKLITLIEETITPDYSSRMIARTLGNIDALLGNIKVFQKAARLIIGGARASQQIGTMLAGLYLLSKTDVCDPARAEEWLQQYDWTDYTTTNQEGDPVRLAQHIATSLVRYTPVSSASQDISIGELIELVYKHGDERADRTLRNYGIVAKPGFICIANRCQNLAKLLRGTEWEMKWSRTLSDLNGAEKKKSVYFSPALKTDAIQLPSEIVIQNKNEWVHTPEPVFEEEIPF